MNQLIVPISFTKIQFLKISSLSGKWWKKVLVDFFLWSPFLNQMKAFIHAPPSIALGKSNTEKQSPSKSLLVVFAATAAKTALNPARNIWRFLALLFNPTFPFVFCHNWEISMVSMVFGLTLYGMEDKWSCLSLLCSPLLWVTLWADRKRRKAFTLKINTSRLLREKNCFETIMGRNFFGRSAWRTTFPRLGREWI